MAEPTAAQMLHRLSITVTGEFLAKLETARAALSHAIPDGDPGAVLERSLDSLLAQVARKRFGEPVEPEVSTGSVPAPEPETETETETEPAPLRKSGNDVADAEPEPAAAPAEPSRPSQDGATPDGPPCAPEPPRSRHIPAATRREVMRRDGGRCAFVSPDGRRCGTDHQVEVHHVHPFAQGGGHSADNLQVLCRAHNHLAARHDYGPERAEAWRQGNR